MATLPTTKFRPISNKQVRKETVEWLVDNSPFFYDWPFPDNVKISISDEVKERKLLFSTGEFDAITTRRKEIGDMYIIKGGNAFSWVTKDLGDIYYNKKELLKVRSAPEIQRNGLIPEIFCEGDAVVIGRDFLTSFDFVGLRTSVGMMNIVSGTPFEQSIAPLVLIKIEEKELQKIFPEKILIRMFLKKARLDNMLNNWRLWAQWSNDTDIKILSILYLYFIGALPLQRWTFKGENIDNGKLYFKKPRHFIHRFEVGIQELALFIGLRRQTIDDHLMGNEKKSSKIKSIFERYPELSRSLKCENILHEGYRFSDTSYPHTPIKGKPGFFIGRLSPDALINDIVLSPIIRKYI